jgi:hypothetical protein
MAEEREFRIGDVAERAGVRSPSVGRPGPDAGTFPTLAALLKATPTEFRDRLDSLAARARDEGSEEVKAALQTAVRLLPELKKDFGG